MLSDDEIPELKFTLAKIYPITDRSLSGLSHSRQTEKLIDGGASLIQLRDKYAASRDFYEDALSAVRIAKDREVRIIINDRVDIALMAGAHGVHLGQDDVPPEEARSLLGDDAIIGYSTHNVAQAHLAATSAMVDYIAFGPIFPTFSKSDPEPIVGIVGLREAREAVGRIPLVAIGGINAENISAVIAAGADSAAMIGELYRDKTDISSRFKELAASQLRE